MTQEELQLIRSMMEEVTQAERKHTAQMVEEKLEVTKRGLQESINGLDVKMSAMQEENNIRFEDLEKGQQAIRTDISKVNHALEPKINAVYEGLEGILRRNEQTDRHEKALADHDNRIYALENVVNK